MRKALLLTVMLFVYYFGTAQINKGQFLIGGNASYSTHKVGPQSGDRQSMFSISPDAGYFVINKLALGVRAGLSAYKVHTSSFYSKSTGFDLSPFVRYYFLPPTKKVNVLAEAAYLHSSVKSEYIYPSSPTSKNETNGYALSAGPAFFLTKNVALEFTLTYQKNTTNKDKTFVAGAGFQIHL